MNKYLLFAGEDYYPVGGFGDFKETSDNLNRLSQVGKDFLKNLPKYNCGGWWHIVDRDTLMTVGSGYGE